ncbi:MAG: 30S ribosomal protein S21 [Christensenellaceae bacterium]|jgi:small subunit ribosomal protein S21|nr:30S ribosomal protein S21 [Christensenellaceae bacterium]
MATVTLKEGKDGKKETLENAIRRWKRKVQNDGIINDLRKHQEFLKPSVRKKLKAKEARKNRHAMGLR